MGLNNYPAMQTRYYFLFLLLVGCLPLAAQQTGDPVEDFRQRGPFNLPGGLPRAVTLALGPDDQLMAGLGSGPNGGMYFTAGGGDWSLLGRNADAFDDAGNLLYSAGGDAAFVGDGSRRFYSPSVIRGVLLGVFAGPDSDRALDEISRDRGTFTNSLAVEYTRFANYATDELSYFAGFNRITATSQLTSRVGRFGIFQNAITGRRDFRSDGYRVAGSFVTVTAVGAGSSPAGLTYFGMEGDGVLFSVRNAASENGRLRRLNSAAFPSGRVSGIDVNPADDGDILVAFRGQGGVVRSTDAGATFTNVTGNLPGEVNDVARIGDARFFAATSQGLYTTTNLAGGQTNWVLASPAVVGTDEVNQIKVRADGLVGVATSEQGVLTGRYVGTGEVVDDGTDDGDDGITEPDNITFIRVSPNPVSRSGRLRVNFRLRSDEAATIRIFDPNGRVAFEQEYPDATEGLNREVIRLRRLRLRRGVHTVVVSTPTDPGEPQRLVVRRR